MRRLSDFAALIFFPLGFAACGGENSTACLTNLPADCAPLYEPTTFAEIHQRTLLPTCARSGGSCHASDGAEGGLVFDDIDRAYRLLLGMEDGRARVVPGKPECSVIVKRLEGTGGVMPPGAPRSEAEKCVVRKWIAAGAER